MDVKEDSINPWVRANLHQPNPETRMLIPEYLRESYDGLVEQRRRSEEALSDAHATVYAAQQAARAAQEQLTVFFAGFIAESATTQNVPVPEKTASDVVRFPALPESGSLPVAA